jgi:hypothetical protein
VFKFSFAGLNVHCQQASPSLLAWLKRAYPHLQLPSDAPCSLRVELYQQPPPAPPGPAEVSWDTFEGRFEKHRGGAELWLLRPQQAFCLDQSQNILRGWVADPASLIRYQRVKPLYLLLSIWAQQRQRTFLHAAYLAHQGRGVALVGHSGSGKSTSSLTAWWGGWDFLGDDIVAFQSDTSQPVGFSLWAALSLETAHLDSLCQRLQLTFEVDVESHANDKSSLFLPAAHPRLVASAPLHAWVAPTIVPGQREARLLRCHPSDMLRALAPSTMLQMMPRPHPHDFQRMAAWVARFPCYCLQLGSDLSSIPGVLQAATTAVGPALPTAPVGSTTGGG